MSGWLPPRDILKHISVTGTEFMTLILYDKRNYNNTIPQFLKNNKTSRHCDSRNTTYCK